jgi:hypothetical protein
MLISWLRSKLGEFDLNKYALLVGYGCFWGMFTVHAMDRRHLQREWQRTSQMAAVQKELEKVDDLLRVRDSGCVYDNCCRCIMGMAGECCVYAEEFEDLDFFSAEKWIDWFSRIGLCAVCWNISHAHYKRALQVKTEIKWLLARRASLLARLEKLK